MEEIKPSVRAEIVTRRTYCRPMTAAEDMYEEWDDVVTRVVDHQRWLWERAKTHKLYPEYPLHDLTEDMWEWQKLTEDEWTELHLLYNLIYNRKLVPAGRTLWLGGTDISRKREASMFNCAHLNIETVYDVVDAFWLLLQG